MNERECTRSQLLKGHVAEIGYYYLHTRINDERYTTHTPPTSFHLTTTDNFLKFMVQKYIRSRLSFICSNSTQRLNFSPIQFAMNSNNVSDKMNVILSIDVGSSSIRCTAYEFKATEPTKIEAVPGCSSSRKISCVEPETGHIILTRTDTNGHSSPSSNREVTLFEDIDGIVEDTISALRDTSHPFKIRGVGITTFVMNLVGIDSASQPCGKDFTLSYACNSSGARKQCLQLKETLGTEALKNMYQRTGAPMHTAYAPAQLKDLYERKPTECENVKIWLSIASICISRWTDVDMLSMPISYSEASWTGMLDFRRGCWDIESLNFFSDDLRKALPHVKDEIFEIGSSDASNSFLERWPEMKSEGGDPACRFLTGFGDGACANIGTKCTSIDRIAVTIGTSAAARICLPLPLLSTRDSSEGETKRRKIDPISVEKVNGFVVPFGLFCYRINKDAVLLGGALTDGGSVIAWLRNLFNLKSESDFLECLKKVDTSYSSIYIENEENASDWKKGLVFVPFLSGERSTGYREHANGCITGLNLSTTAADLLRESMESVILRINAIINLIKQSRYIISSEATPQSSTTNGQIITSGNALEKNELWRRMLADCSNMKVIVDSEAVEGTSRGAMLLVANALADSLNQFGITGRSAREELAIKFTTDPNSLCQGYWSKKKENQEALINRMESIWNGK